MFQLDRPILIPDTFYASTIRHGVLTEQLTIPVPLPDSSVYTSRDEWSRLGENSVVVPFSPFSHDRPVDHFPFFRQFTIRMPRVTIPSRLGSSRRLTPSST